MDGAEEDGVAVTETQAGSIFRGDENVVASRGAGERVAVGIDHRVELLAAASGEVEAEAGGERLEVGRERFLSRLRRAWNHTF